MNNLNLPELPSFREIFDFFLKIGLIILSIIYVLYATVASRQIKIMTETLVDDRFNHLILLFSSIQIFLGFILLVSSLFLI
ncbi:MAG: hypothetical protein NZL96_01585 [Patescibacteria group bacterium]|nr:hypothetical protein [Patescibacteria group bacterium]